MNVLIVPGLGNSGEGHWQTIWEQTRGFERVQQNDWETPVREDWVARLDEAVVAAGTEDVVLVGHSLACCTIVNWAAAHPRKIRGALLVAPSDTEADSYPPGTKGFTPMPLNRLPFRSIAVASTNDFYVTPERARQFADAWGSELVVIGPAGHINVASGFGEWPEGLVLLNQL